MLQKTGTFKLRGALNCIEALDAEAKARGVVAVSAEITRLRWRMHLLWPVLMPKW
jgi:hypothetical protein